MAGRRSFPFGMASWQVWTVSFKECICKGDKPNIHISYRVISQILLYILHRWAMMGLYQHQYWHNSHNNCLRKNMYCIIPHLLLGVSPLPSFTPRLSHAFFVPKGIWGKFTAREIENHQVRWAQTSTCPNETVYYCLGWISFSKHDHSSLWFSHIQ